MFGMRFLTNFEAFIYIISLKGITNKIIYFSLTQNGCKKAFILFAIPLRKIRQKQVLKLIKNRIPNIIKSIKKHGNLIKFVMFGMQFFFNFEISIFYNFPKSITNKLFIFSRPKIDSKKPFLGSHTLEENNINKTFKIGQKIHTKHHQIDQISMFFDRFDDV